MAMQVGELDVPLLQLSLVGDYVTARDFNQNAFVTGVTGGGKTSGPGRHILKALLLSGGGGIVLCQKPGEADEIRALCAQTGRLPSLIHWTGRNYGFNFLGYLLAKLGQDGINGVTEYLMRIIEMIRGASALPGGNGDAFWLDTLRVILRYTLIIVHAATGSLRLADIMAFVRSAPTAPEQMTDPAWQERSFFYRCFMAVRGVLDDASCVRIGTYWRDDFSKMEPKLRGNILAGFAMLDRFNHGWLHDAFCGGTNVVPALTFHGAIIVLDMPRATMGEDGIVAQMIFKDAWQTDVLGRNALPPGNRERFVFCYADEAQEVITSEDANFLAMSRSSRSTTIYLTQSLPSMYAKLGGANARDRAHHLIGNFGIKIFCANSCAETNDFAARTIGRALQDRANSSRAEGHSTNSGMSMGDGSNWGVNSSHGYNSGWSSGPGGSSSSGGTSWSQGSSAGGSDNRGANRGQGTSSTVSQGSSEVMDYIIEPGLFGRILRMGGPANGNRVSAIWYQAGRIFRASQGNALLVEFQQ